jgi:PAS domain S-box-containing protein
MRPRPAISNGGYQVAALLAVVMVTVLALGWIVARDLHQSAEDANQQYDRFSDGLDLIDELLFETGEVRRILLYALHTSDANRQLEYAEQSRAAEADVRRLLRQRSALSSNPRTKTGLEAVSATWTQYVIVRDEVIGLILEGSLREGVAFDEQEGTARFNAVRGAIADLKSSFEADAARQVADQRQRADRATTRLSLMVVSALLATVIGIYLINRRSALEGLLRSEAHKGSILQAVPDAILSTDEHGAVIELNDAAETTFGFTREEALGANIEALILPPEARAALAAVLATAYDASPTVPARLQTIGQRRDGSRFPIGLAAAAHTGGRNRIWTLHIIDLTDQHRAEEQLRGAKEAAEVAARVKSEFLATMSHELRTPLTGVVGISDLLQVSDLAAPERDLIRMLRSSATALLGLVNDILDYSRIEAGLLSMTTARCSVRAVIEEALDTVAEPAARKGLEIGYVVDGGVDDVLADCDRVRQVLLNLLSNAVKFTTSGEVAVRVTAHPAADGRQTIVIRVRDTGIGIPMHLQHRLFQRFSQIDQDGARQFGGAGLGLAISERLSRLLGGSLTVESRDGRGSTFTFAFTAERAPQADPAGRETRLLSGVRVLAFLRAGIVAEQLRAHLRDWDIRVVMAKGERPAPAPGTKVDAILVDADAADGETYLSVIRNRRKWGLQRVPVITVMRRRPSGERERSLPGEVVATPIRAQALHDALCTAVGIAAPLVAIEDPAERHRFHPDDLKILLVEDNDANRRVVRLMLAELGLEADEAPGGIAAVARARQCRYDVILMDVQMFDIDGLEATRRIRAEQRGKPPVILALTANVMESDEARCREAGMNGYLPKPLRLIALEEALAALLTSRF